MALNNEDTYNLLREINEYGATIFYMLENDKMKLSDIENILFKPSIDQIMLLFPKFIKKIKVAYIEQAREVYGDSFTKLDCVDRIIKKDNDKHIHLKEIRDIVYLDKKLDELIKDSTYTKAFNLHYTYKIIEKLEEENKRAFLSIRETIKLYKVACSVLIDECDKEIGRNIDSYYISSIAN